MQDLQEAIEMVRQQGYEVSARGRMLCPFHDEHNASGYLWRNPNHDGQIEFRCFGCGASMTVESLLQRLGASHVKSVVAKPRNNPPLVDLESVASQAQQQFRQLLEAHDPRSAIAQDVLRYLESRGVGQDLAQELRIGLIFRGELLKKPALSKCSWISKGNRPYFVTIPIVDYNTGTVANIQFEDFAGRGRRDTTKFFAPERAKPLFFITKPNPEDELFVAEGVYDAISLHTAKVQACALLGQPSQAQIEQLKQFPYLCLALDNDSPGKSATEKLQEDLLPTTERIRHLILPQGFKDPNELALKDSPDALVDAIESAKSLEPFPPVCDILSDYVAQEERLKKLTIELAEPFTFFNDLCCGGLKPGLYAVAGIPGAGKTTLLNQLADQLAQQQVPSVYLITEEAGYRLLQRTVRRLGLGSIAKLQQQQRMVRYRRIIDLQGEWDVQWVARAFQAIAKRTARTPVFFIDSMHALPSAAEARRLSLREQNTLKISHLARVTRDLEAVVFFTSFMPKDKFEARDLTVFKETADIAYLIDVGIVVNQPKEGGRQGSQKVSITINKNRFGPKGTEELEFDPRRCEFNCGFGI